MPRLIDTLRPIYDSVPPVPRMLGLAGLVPQVLALAVILVGGVQVQYTAQALGFAYACLILSFLGGLWWGLAAGARAAPAWVYGAAVAPSLFALATTVPWAVGWEWPGPSMILLGLAILGSLEVDRRLAALKLTPGWWMALRVPLSVGLGVTTLLIGISR